MIDATTPIVTGTLVAAGLAFAAWAYATDRPYGHNLTCDMVAETLIPSLADRPIHPVRVFDVEPGTAQGGTLTCNAQAWFSNGMRVPIWFEWTRVDGQEFVEIGVRG
jgi:hypothetical protein